MSDRWDYDNWPSMRGQGWVGGPEQAGPYDNIDFHVDLGCGRVKKARIGVDHFEAPGVDWVCDLEQAKLPFADSQIHSIITHHCLEHIGDGFIPLMEEIHRVLRRNGILRVIVPLFPSTSAVCDPDHKRYFMERTFAPFYVDPSGNSWLESFSVPYIGTAKFRELETICSKPTSVEDRWGPDDDREMRVAMEAWKP